MKIDPTALRPTASRRAGAGLSAASPGEFARTLREESGAGALGSIGGPVGLGGLTAMLAVQETPDQMARRARQRARERAGDILDQLDEIRIGLLLGTIPASRLESLAQQIRAKREQVSDPRLDQILDDIELRAAVELAKLGQGAA
jgi:hypothetical protein